MGKHHLLLVMIFILQINGFGEKYEEILNITKKYTDLTLSETNVLDKMFATGSQAEKVIKKLGIVASFVGAAMTTVFGVRSPEKIAIEELGAMMTESFRLMARRFTELEAKLINLNYENKYYRSVKQKLRNLEDAFKGIINKEYAVRRKYFRKFNMICDDTATEPHSVLSFLDDRFVKYCPLPKNKSFAVYLRIEKLLRNKEAANNWRLPIKEKILAVLFNLEKEEEEIFAAKIEEIEATTAERYSESLKRIMTNLNLIQSFCLSQTIAISGDYTRAPLEALARIVTDDVLRSILISVQCMNVTCWDDPATYKYEEERLSNFTTEILRHVPVWINRTLIATWPDLVLDRVKSAVNGKLNTNLTTLARLAYNETSSRGIAGYQHSVFAVDATGTKQWIKNLKEDADNQYLNFNDVDYYLFRTRAGVRKRRAAAEHFEKNREALLDVFRKDPFQQDLTAVNKQMLSIVSFNTTDYYQAALLVRYARFRVSGEIISGEAGSEVMSVGLTLPGRGFEVGWKFVIFM